jgi:hypothetical protein
MAKEIPLLDRIDKDPVYQVICRAGGYFCAFYKILVSCRGEMGSEIHAQHRPAPDRSGSPAARSYGHCAVKPIPRGDRCGILCCTVVSLDP